METDNTFEVEQSNISKDEDGHTVLALSYPVAKPGKEGEKVSELVFRRPTVADLAAMDETKGDVAKSQRILSNICNLPMVMVQKLDGYDYLQAQAVVAGFLSKPR